MPPCRARARTRIHPEAKAVTGSGNRRVQISDVADGGASVMVPASAGLLHAPGRPELAEGDAAALDNSPVIVFHRAVQIDRRVIAGRAQQRDHALRLAERIGADQMRALGKQRHGRQQLLHLIGGIAVRETPAGRKVASVMKTSQGTSSNGVQVGSGASL